MQSELAEDTAPPVRICAADDCDKPIVGRRKQAIFCSTECNDRVHQKRWRERNQEHLRAKAREWRLANLDRARENQAEWRKANPERWQEICRASWHRNKHKYNPARQGDPKAKARMREWQKANPDKIREYNRRRKATVRGAEGRHTEAELLSVWARYGGCCAYCGAEAEHTDHIMPLSLGGSDWPENLAPACEGCNLSKKNKHPDRWYAELIAKQMA